MSYVQRDSLNLKEAKDTKENKENNNVLNVHAHKPSKLNQFDSLPLCKAKLEHKNSESTAYTSSLPS